MFLWVQNDSFDERKRFSWFETNLKPNKKFSKLAEKKLKCNHSTKGGTIGKKFLETCFYEFKMIVLMKEKVFDGFRAIWSLIKNFQFDRKEV